MIVIKSGDPEQSKQCNPSKHNSYERYNNKLTEVAKPQNVRVNMYRLLKYRRHVGLSCMGGLCGHDSQLATHAMVQLNDTVRARKFFYMKNDKP